MTLAVALIAILLAAYALKTISGLRRKVTDLERRLTDLRISHSEDLADLGRQTEGLKGALSALVGGHEMDPSEGPFFDEIDTAEAVQMLENPETVIVDVREPQEYAAGHIPGAIWIPLGQIPQRWEEIPREAPDVIIHCAVGSRSEQACAYLSEEKGYRNLHNLGPGIQGWRGELEAGMG